MKQRSPNWNLREKLSKIGIFGNFNFWLKVHAKVKVNGSTIRSQWLVNNLHSLGWFWVFRGRSGLGYRSTNVARACVVLTWLDEVIE